MFVAIESAYDTLNTTGSEYMPLKVTQQGLGDIEFLDEFSGNNYAVGLPRGTREERLRGGAQIRAELVWTPYAAAALTNTSTVSATLDALDILLRSGLGTAVTRAGVAVTAKSGSTVTFGSAPFTVGDVIALYESGVNSSRVRHFLSTDEDSNVYDLDADPGSYTSAAVAIGYREFRSEGADAASFSGYFQDDTIIYELSGGQFIPESMAFEAGGLYRVIGAMRFNQIRFAGSVGGGSVTPPSVTSGVIIETPVKAELGDLVFGGTSYSGLSAATLNFNNTTVWEPGLDGTNGRVGQRSLTNFPTLDCTFASSNTWRALMSAETTGRIRARVGSGAVASSKVNALALSAHEAQVLATARQDDGGRARQSVSFKLCHAGVIGADTPATPPYFSLTRF